MKNNHKPTYKTAVLGGGCFWCLEALYSGLKGVVRVVSGYAGGNPPVGGTNPTYEEVSSGRTGHTEAIKITFDPKVISYEDILNIFFLYHDPTTLNRQGNDIGTQYRSIVLYSGEGQKKTAEKVKEEVAEKKIYSDPIVTRLEPLGKFYVAEDYHQKYFEKNPKKAYCQIVIAPKLQKFKKEYAKFMKD
jgi:peptide-methionine (S)-S-oxide reductase